MSFFCGVSDLGSGFSQTHIVRGSTVVIAADPAIAAAAAGPAFAGSRALAIGPACAADLAAN